MKCRLLFGLSLAAVMTAQGATAQTIAITGGTVYPVSGPRIEHGTVLIQDGRIVAVGTNVTVPAGATVIDATGKWVTPGLINASTQLGIEEIEGATETRDNIAKPKDAIAAAFTAVDGLNPRSPLIPYARQGGVTSVGVLPQYNVVAGQAAMVDLVPGGVKDMVLIAPAAMVAEVGDATTVQMGARGEVIGLLRSLLEDTKRYAAHRADYEQARTRPFITSHDNLEAMVPVIEGKLPLLVTAQRASDIMQAVELAHEFGIRLVIAGGAEAWEVADKLAAAHVTVMTGALNDVPDSFSRLGQRQENAAMLRRAGVSVVLVGNCDEEDSAPFTVRNIRQVAGTAVAYGMTWDDALRAVTLSAAEVFGVADRIGSLQPGREGNVVVWSGDPFEFSTQPEHVIVRGHEIHDVTRQDQLTARYKTLPANYGPASR